MQFKGYISKYLYSRIANQKVETISTPLNDEELRAIHTFNIPYHKTIDRSGIPIYVLKAKDIKAVFCN